MKNSIGILIILFVSITLTAQEFDFDQSFKEAYLTANTDLYLKNIETLRQTYSSSQAQQDLFNLAKAQYYATSAFMATKDKKEAKKLLDNAEKGIKKYLKKEEDSGAAHALLSAIYGLQIGLSPMKGMTLGGKSSKHLDQALALSPNDPFVLMLKGSNLYYTPSMWGGDPKEAIEYLLQAKKILQEKGKSCSIDWHNTMALLGQAYHYQEQYHQALESYQLALKESSNFGWVKYNLLPKLEKEM